MDRVARREEMQRDLVFSYLMFQIFIYFHILTYHDEAMRWSLRWLMDRVARREEMQRERGFVIIYTRSYAALRAADLDWIVGPGYSLGRVHSGEKP